MSTIITVSGSAEVKRSPERATAHLSVGFEGPERELVVEQSTSLHRSLSDQIASLRAAAVSPVSDSSSEQLRVWGQRPWSQNGEQLPVVYHSAASVTVTFTDFTALSEWIGDASLREGVTVNGIDWALSDDTKRELTRQAQKDAVAAACDKAEIYAQSLGLTAISPLALSDPGLLGDDTAPAPMMAMAADSMRMRGGNGGGGPQFAPEEIVIAASVHARFSAS